MPMGKKIAAAPDRIRSMTEKGDSAYPGEVVHGAYGFEDSGGVAAGPGAQNLSPPRGDEMGHPSTGVGLPPSGGINMSMTQPPCPLPPGPEVDPGLPIKCELPPGPDADPGLPVACPLPPGPTDMEQGAPETGITPAGPPI
jgi:hypothetical protein